ncbi:flagellar export protein FliJ [Lentibacillus salinarum]|uniref:Flagellar FliJ protein n=1 Tax=Lentibacillus salinarum TaxID=446820 RepID=A0ABW3ZQ27_9BACI
MTGTAALSKVLHIRESEKEYAQKAYQESMDIFEEVATELYELLRKKETAEAAYEECLTQPTSIDKVREQATYIENLTKQIMDLQRDVQKARHDMETRHEHLSDAYVEVKKFKKIIDQRQKRTNAIIKKNEEAQMDDISMRQYMSQKSGESNGTENRT